MIDFLFIAAGIALFWATGLSFLLLLNAGQRLQKTAPVFGAAVFVLIAYPLYFFHVPIPVVQGILAALSIAAMLFLLRRKPKGQWKWLAGLLGLYSLLALPLFIGGEQYYVFRGNIFDHFFYLSESLTAYSFPIQQMRALSQSETAQTFGTWVATGQCGLLFDRPAIAVLFSCFLTPGLGDIVTRAAMFNTAFIALLWLSVQYLWDAVLGGSPACRFPRAVRFLPPFAFSVGFFSQFSFDINAWSQITSTPILALMLCLYGERLRHVLQMEPSKTLSTGQSGVKGPDPAWICLALLATAGCALYVEGYVSYCAALVIISLFFWLWRSLHKKRILAKEACLLPVIMLGAVILAFLPNWKSSVAFLVSQFKNATGSLSHADFFFRYWQGRVFSDSSRTVLNYLPSVLGFYYLTPDYEEAGGSLARNLLSGGMLLLNLLIVAGLTAAVIMAVRKKRFYPCYLAAAALTAFGAFLLLLITGQTWTAGKYLQYLSPCVFLLMCLGLLPVDDGGLIRRKIRISAWLATALAAITIVCNIGFGAARIALADEPSGVGYVSTYPAILDWENKTKYRWQVDLTPVEGCQTLEISTDLDCTGFYSNWLFLKAIYAGKAAYTTAELTMNFGAAVSYGHMQPIACDGYLRAEDPDGDGVYEAVAGKIS